jgi:hypothetical protein
MRTAGGPKKAVAALFLAALVLRLAAFATIDPILGMNAQYTFLGGAQRLVSGDGFGDPSYPLLSAPLYAVLIATACISSATTNSRSSLRRRTPHGRSAVLHLPKDLRGEDCAHRRCDRVVYPSSHYAAPRLR